MELELFKNILDFFNKKLYVEKVSDTGFRYVGLIIDDYFDNSVLAFDFLNLDYYLAEVNGMKFDERENFLNLYLNISEDKRILLVEKILKILKHTSFNKEENQQIIEMIFNFLKKNNYTILNNDSTLEIIRSKFIGQGSYCNVYQETEMTVRKVLKPGYSVKEDFRKRLKYEFENTLKLKDCPNIIKVIEYNSDDNSYTMEKCDDDLYSFMQKNIEISYENKIKIALDILNGMKFAHDNNIIHRDLHLGNILQIGKSFVIADFGWSKDLDILRSLKSSSSPKSNNRYVAPEAISDFSKLDEKTDIYSIGQILDDIFRNTLSSRHEFSLIIDKCVDRNRYNRYNNIDLILADFKSLLESKEAEDLKAKIFEDINKGTYTLQVHKYILELADNSSLSRFIIEHRLANFSELFFKFNNSDQMLLINSIDMTFPSATGYNGWSNYDFFTNLAYSIYKGNVSKNVKDIAFNIISYCAKNINRYHAQMLLETISCE
ncbi:MAG: protein kinase domain-containing protein [Cetobacterium sp.]|uniref:protein kinase domain-containing protein n=1 Tax=Cetobacterium sp. TaxID=2071632 RepID=UPI003F3A2B43